MRILQVVHGFPPKRRAGTEIYTYSLSRELAKRHEVHVFYPVFDNIKKKISLNSFEQDNLTIHELKIPKNKFKIFWNSLFLKNTYINKDIESIFRKLLKEIKPDIIHFEHLISLSVTLIDIAKDKFRIPTILTLHDYWFICPNIYYLKCDYTICKDPDPNKCRECWIKNQSKILSDALNQYHIPKILAEKLLKFFLRVFNPPEIFEIRNQYLKSLLLKKVDKIISPSRFLRRVFIKYGVPEDKIIYSENGYDFNKFKGFKKKNKNINKIFFGFVGGISEHKGIHVLINAFMNIPEEKAELRIYGNYDSGSEYVRKILTKARKKKNIKFMGGFEDVKVPYSEIDVLIVPSIVHETGGPLVVREALIAKVPVIASRVGSIPELIANNVNGLLFEPNNSKDLYEKIMLIIEHPKLIEEFKLNIKPPRSIEEQVKEIEKIYRSLIEG